MFMYDVCDGMNDHGHGMNNINQSVSSVCDAQSVSRLSY